MKKKVAVFITVISDANYQLLTNLLALDEPADKSFDDIDKVLNIILNYLYLLLLNNENSIVVVRLKLNQLLTL